MSDREQRPAARILLVGPDNRILLFRFDPPDRPPFWCTPGGAVDAGETHDEAARRELLEECGIDADCGPQVARRTVEFVTLANVPVVADERYYRVTTSSSRISTAGHTELEQAVMREYRWFARSEIEAWPEPIFPEQLGRMLDELGDFT